MGTPLTDSLFGPASTTPLSDSLFGNPEEEEEEKEQSPFQEVLQGGAGAAVGLHSSLSRASLAMMPDFLKSDRLLEEHRSATEAAQLLAPDDQRPFLARLRDKPFTTLGRTAAEVVPSLVPVIAGALVGGPGGAAAAGAATGFTTSGLDAYDEAIEQGNDERTSMTIGGVVGVLSALLEGIGAKGIAKPLQSAFGKELTKRVVRGETDTLIRQILAGAGKEGLTEGYQELVAAGGELMAGKPLDEVIQTLDDRVAQGVTGGLLLGTATGSAATLRHAGRTTRARRNARQELFEQARAMEPEALAEFMRPRQSGEWAMKALPTGDWTVDALTEAHEALENVVVPDVLGPTKKGLRESRGGIKRSAGWLGSERPVISLVRQGFGDKVGDQIQDLFSYSRKGSTVGRTIVDAEIRNHANEAVAPAYKDIQALVTPIQEHPSPDPTKGKWLTQYAGVRDSDGNVKLKNGKRVLPGHLDKNAGLRYHEESRWALRVDDVAKQIEKMKVERDGLVTVMDELKKTHRTSQIPEKKVAARLKQLAGRVQTLRDRRLAIKAKMQVGSKQKRPLKNLEAAQEKITKELATIDAEFESVRSETTAAGESIQAEMKGLQERIDQIDGHLKSQKPAHVKAARERLTYLRQHPQWKILEKAAEAASQWDQHMVTMMADAEIISRDQEAKILDRGKHYAGFFVATPEAQPPVVRERLTRGSEEPGRLKVGLRRDVPLMLPSEASLFRAATVQRDAYKQISKNEMLKLVEAAPEFWAQAGVTLEPVEGIHRPEVKVRAMREGEEVPVYMPKELLLAFEQMTPVEGSVLQEGMKTYFRAIANQRRATALLTPTFAVGQVFRDQPEAALFAAEVGYRPYVDMARGMIHMLTGSPEARSFRQFGGGMGSIASLDIETSQDMLADVALRAKEEDIQSTAKLATARLMRLSRTWAKQEVWDADIEHTYSGLFYPMARLLETLDTSTRLGVYLRGLDKQFTEAESLAVSRRGAIDFALQGQNTAWGSQFLPFMGARAQGFALNREAVKRAGRKSTEAAAESKDKGWTISQAVALKAGGAALLPLFYMVLLPELVHFSIHADDEEFHTTREDWEKQKYYHWFQLDDGEWLKTPRPLGYLSRLFGFGVGQALDEAYRNEPKTLENVLAVLQDDIPGAAEFPLGFGATQPMVLREHWARFGVRTEGVPPGLEPALPLAFGVTPWQNRLVVPHWQEERVPPRQQGFRTTPQVYIDFAKVIPGNAEEEIWALTHPGEQLSRMAHAATGGAVGSEERFSTTADTSKKLTSPLYLEQAGQFLTGSVGSEIRRTGEIKQKLASGEPIPLSHIPVVRNFFARAKDAPQMWPIRRVLELAEEGKKFIEAQKMPGEEPEQVEELDPWVYDQVAVRAQEIREMLTDWHEMRRAGDEAAMAELDEEIRQKALEALEEHGRFTGSEELGASGRGWAAKFYRRLNSGGGG